ncbi:hypothetical protein PHLH5_27640 [Pseudomonas sp. Cab53]|nr:hypothetical protein PHLH5_27640 [Pseudomonas sp. Cab53]
MICCRAVWGKIILPVEMVLMSTNSVGAMERIPFLMPIKT